RAGTRRARARSLGRAAGGQAHGRGGGRAPAGWCRPGPRRRPRHRGQGGGEQGPGHGLDARRVLARRRRGPGPAGGSAAGRGRAPLGAPARLRWPHARRARGARRPGDRPGAPPLVIALLPREAWRRNQLVVCVAVFMVFMGFAFVLPFLPLYVRDLGVSSDEAAATWAGVLIGIAPLLAGLLAPVWGRLGDRYGQKPMAVRALVSYVILLALSGAVTTVWELLALRTAVGLFGGVGPLGLAMATALAPREQTG